MKISVFYILGSAILLSGCGFCLSDAAPIAQTYPELFLAGDDNDALYKSLEANLITRNVKVTSIKASDAKSYINGDVSVLTCSKMISSSSVVSVAGNAQNLEYTRKSKASCLLYVKGKKPYSIKESINQPHLEKTGATIAKNSEYNTIDSDNVNQLTSRIIYRLEHSYLTQANIDQNSKKTSEPKPLVIIFNSENTDNSDNAKNSSIKKMMPVEASQEQILDSTDTLEKDSITPADSNQSTK